MRSLLLRWAILAVALAVAAWLLDSITVEGGFWGYVWVAALFGLVNAFVRPLVSLLALPLTILTFGLFAFVVNALMLLFTAWISDRLEVDGFLTAVGAAVIIAVVSMVLNRLLVERKD